MNKKRLIISIVLTFLLALALPGWAANYYMHALGTAGSRAAAVGPSTDSTKCINLADHNAAHWYGTDVIVISSKGGEFDGALIPIYGGSAGSPISYVNETGETPVFNGGATASALRLYNLGYINFTGIELEGGTSFTIDWDGYASNINFTNCYIHDCVSHLVNMQGGQARTFKFSKCRFKNGYRVFYFYPTAAIASGTISQCIIEGGIGSIGNLVLDSAYAHNIISSDNLYIGAYSAQIINNSLGIITMRNDEVVASCIVGQDYPLQNQSTGTIDYDYCLIQPNQSGQICSNIGGGTVVDGGHNKTSSPVFVRNAKTAMLSLGLDLAPPFTDADTLATYAESKGLRIYVAASVDLCTPTDWAVLQGLINRGHGVAAMGKGNLESLEAMSIRYTGNGSACIMTVDDNVLSTAIAGQTDGSANLTLDLTASAYKFTADLVAYINGRTGYTCTLGAALNTHSTALADVTAGDIKTVPVTALLDQTKYFANEITEPKTTIEANLLAANSSDPYVCTVYVWPNAYHNAAAEAAAQAAGYLGARAVSDGTVTSLLSSIKMFRLKSQNATTWGTTGIVDKIQAILDGSCYAGEIRSIHSHNFGGADETYANWQIIIDTLATYKAKHPEFQVLTLSAAVDYIIANGTTVDAGTTYTRTLVDLSNYRLQPSSPSIAAGDSTVAPHGTLDYEGRNLWGDRGAPPIGPYANPPGVGFGF